MRVRAGPPDAVQALVRALERRIGGLAATLHPGPLSSVPWKSITISGARLRLTLRIAGEDAGLALRALRSAEAEDLELNGHVLADLTVAETGEEEGMLRLTLDALTVEKAGF